MLGLYEGIPLTARGSWYVAAMPDRIRIFRIPILQMCSTQADVVREVYITVVHEVGHHFGIDDDRLHGGRGLTVVSIQERSVYTLRYG